MGFDYYKILQVDTNTKDDDLKEAYRKLAIACFQADIVFIIDEKAHSVFTGEGDDLVVTLPQRISVAEGLTGYTVHLGALEGRNLSIAVDNVIHPNYEEVVPTSKRRNATSERSNKERELEIVKFNINFPTRLTAEQKGGIKRLLGS